MAETKRTFEQDDLFKRKPYAEFLEKLILNSDSYHRDDDVQAYTIAIDSPWGTGKSVFLEKFENMLKADYPDRIRVIHYSAWKNDFWDNAFEPFADAIFTSEWFCSALEDDTNEQAMKKFFGAAKNVMLSFVKKQTEEHFDAELLEKAIEDFAAGLKVASSKKVSFVSKSYLDYVASLKQMQKAMAEVLSKTLPGGKLVIVIDELDRCRPTFAIDTLEIVKHVMDVPNIVYLFALDVQQLGAAIKKVYGSETDAIGYLMRFFSYYSRLPEANLKSFLKDQFGKDRLNSDLIDSMASTAELLKLSARDLETVSKVYRLMETTFLHRYNITLAYKLYWMLLCAKYKNPIQFNNTLLTGEFLEEENSDFSDMLGLPLEKVQENEPLKNLQFDIYCEDGRVLAENVRIFNVYTRGDKRLIIQCVQETSSSPGNTVEVCYADTASGLLFFPDLLFWQQIKHLTPGQFLLKRLEMFDFISKSDK